MASPAEVSSRPTPLTSLSPSPAGSQSASASLSSTSSMENVWDQAVSAAATVAAATVTDSNIVLPITPKVPSKCPLFCCFYSEFDIKKGPVICFESPKGFMDKDINVSLDTIHDLLANTFQELKVKQPKAETVDGGTGGNEEQTAKLQTDSVKAHGEVDAKETIDGKSNPKSSTMAAEEPTKSVTEQDATPQSPPAISSTPSAESLAGLSIFDSTSEYIITGSELTSKIITLSTHNWHIMTRPTMISDARYERNAHLFSVGIVLRRAADPRPFRPLISKLALTLEAMEKESNFLTSTTATGNGRPQIQTVLENVLLSLNSADWECNLLLNKSNFLNLKLYHPPKPETSKVHDHQVPILLRRDIQLQMYDCDLAINWVILHIDGVTNARHISIKAEVDLEMVRACLRVLKHHGVIALVSQFSYSNRYEFTAKATSMLAGKEPRLLQEALEFSMKRFHSFGGQGGSITNHSHASHSQGGGGAGTTGAIASLGMSIGSDHGLAQSNPSSSYPPRTMGLLGGSQQSHNFRYAMMAAHSLEKEASSGSRRGEDQRLWKSALAELYCACNRNVSFGDLWLSLTSEAPVSSVSIPNALTTNPLGSSVQSKSNRFLSAPRHASSRRKGSISEEYPEDATDHSSVIAANSLVDTLALSPSETHRLESLRRGGRNSQKQASVIDWKDFFQRIDHRRFLTFGLIHGLLIRVHAYPYFPSKFPEGGPSRTTSPISIPPADLSSSEATWNTSNTVIPNTSVAATTYTTAVSNTSHTSTSRQSLKKQFLEQKAHKFAQNVAEMMDGSRCDDELACVFEKPFIKLTELVEKHGRSKVISFYAEAADG